MEQETNEFLRFFFKFGAFFQVEKNQLNHYKSKYVLSYANMSTEKELFQKYTGIEHEQYINLYNFLNPGKYGENIKYHNSALSDNMHKLGN
ncbi:MAG: hypothetical protein K2P53_01575 [Rickettsiales bacterium]|jgi:hypothetical protein|nr:hypothetical protein [Rickettsiales bacterium]